MTVAEDGSIVEAIFEMRWKFAESAENEAMQNYYLMIGRMYDALDDYKFYEPLQSASVPNQIAQYLIQHRFRIAAGKWPLVQMGPRIITVNSTQDYDWKDFEARISRTYDALVNIYPTDPYDLRATSLTLRYVNAINVDYDKYKTLSFLKKEMKTTVNFDSKLFESTDVANKPQTLDCKFSFASSNPRGEMNFRFYRGKAGTVDAIIWETLVESKLDDIPEPLNLKVWLKSAHRLAKKWYETIKGTADGV
jgi:uncharacterized protein (TIGR04255 family)